MPSAVTERSAINQTMAAMAVGAFLCCGCNNSQQPQSSSRVKRIPLFDQLAGAPQYSNAIAAADCDLPGDEWMKFPFKLNQSRGRRVTTIAQKILLEVESKLKQMSVTELVQCLKVEDGSGFVTNYIADALYPTGNNMIISEIKSRPEVERAVLLKWPLDEESLNTGSNGEAIEVYQVVEELAPALTKEQYAR